MDQLVQQLLKNGSVTEKQVEEARKQLLTPSMKALTDAIYLYYSTGVDEYDNEELVLPEPFDGSEHKKWLGLAQALVEDSKIDPTTLIKAIKDANAIPDLVAFFAYIKVLAPLVSFDELAEALQSVGTLPGLFFGPLSEPPPEPDQSSEPGDPEEPDDTTGDEQPCLDGF